MTWKTRYFETREARRFPSVIGPRDKHRASEAKASRELLEKIERRTAIARTMPVQRGLAGLITPEEWRRAEGLPLLKLGAK